MKYKLFLAAAMTAMFAAGCATLQSSKEILEFNITPEKGIKAGSFITVVVRTVVPVEKVYGYLDVMGSPKIPFRYDARKKAWVFAAVIPVTMQVPKGDFIAKIEAISSTGEKFISEKKVSTY